MHKSPEEDHFVFWAAIGVVLLTLLAVLLNGCAIPDVGDIHLAECMHICNAEARSCVMIAEAVYKADGNPKAYAEDAQVCAFDLVDCLAVCVDETEQVLR